jgi:hypothetical protein
MRIKRLCDERKDGCWVEIQDKQCREAVLFQPPSARLFPHLTPAMPMGDSGDGPDILLADWIAAFDSLGG